MLDFGPKVLVAATAPDVSLRVAGSCSFFAFYPPLLLTHVLLACTYRVQLTIQTNQSNMNLSFSTFTQLRKTKTVSSWEFLSCSSMFALDLKDTKPHSIFGARDITALTLKHSKQKAFVSSCFFPQLTDLLYCHCELALKGLRRFSALSHSLF